MRSDASQGAIARPQPKQATTDLRLMPEVPPRRGMWGMREALIGAPLASLLFFAAWWFIVSPEWTWFDKSAVIGTGVLSWMLLFYIGSLVIVALLGPDGLDIGLDQLGFRSLSWTNFVAYGVLGAAGMGIVFGGYSALADAVGPFPSARPDLPIVWAAERHRLSFAAAATVLRPFTEEVLFRGFLMQGLAPRLRAPTAAVVTSALYALTYIGGGPGLMLPAFGAGLVLAWVFWRSGSLWPAILANVIFSAIIVDSRVG